MKKIFNILIALILVFSLSSCEKHEKNDRLQIVTTIFPQYSFVKEIVGDLCDVEVLLKPGQDSHNFDPSVQTVVLIKNADMFVYTHDEMEAWATKLVESLDKKTVCMSAKGIELEVVQEEHDEHEHDNKAEDHHGHHHQHDPHVWTSIRNCITMVNNITASICQLDPDNAPTYKNNSARYVNELQVLDNKFVELFKGFDKELFFVSPFTFYYFIKDYGLHYHSLYKTCSLDVEPSASEIIEFVNLIKEENIEFIYKKEFMSDIIPNKIVDLTGTKIRVLNSGHNVTYQDYDKGTRYIDILNENYEVLKEGVN